MREMTVREANQNFSQVIAAAERGDTIIITKNGVPVAKISPQSATRSGDPEWQATYKKFAKAMLARKPTGLRVGRITEDDLYG